MEASRSYASIFPSGESAGDESPSAGSLKGTMVCAAQINAPTKKPAVLTNTSYRFTWGGLFSRQQTFSRLDLRTRQSRFETRLPAE